MSHRHKAARTPFEYTKADGTEVLLEVCRCGLACWIENEPGEPSLRRKWEAPEAMSAKLGDSINAVVHCGERELVWDLAVFMTACDDEINRQSAEAFADEPERIRYKRVLLKKAGAR